MKPVISSTNLLKSNFKRTKKEEEVSDTHTTLTTCPEDHVIWAHDSKYTEDDQAII
jgi:hypothetical protein